MTDEQTTQTDQPQPAPSDAWRDVGKQFEALGQSLATAIRTAWDSEENRRRTQSMKTGLEAMVNELGKAIKETADSHEGQRARSEAENAAQSLRSAGAQPPVIRPGREKPNAQSFPPSTITLADVPDSLASVRSCRSRETFEQA